MSGSDCWTPKDGRHRREFCSLLFISTTPSICSEGACALRGSIHLGAFRFETESRQMQHFVWVLPILLKSNLTASREPTHNNQFLLFLNSYVPRIVSALLGHNSREGVLVVGFWGLTPDRVPLSLGEMGGPILGCSGDLNGCQITRGGFKRDA